MKKILILSGSDSGKKALFTDLVRKNFRNKDSEIVLGNINSTFVILEPGKLKMRVGNVDINDYSLVYLRGIAGGNIFTATLVAIVFEALGIKYFDTLYGSSGPHRTKLGSLALIASNNIQIPKTVYFADKNYVGHFDELSKELGLPFVAKEMSLQRGKGVSLIKSIEDIKNLPEKTGKGSENDYFFQKFINKDHEYRILTMNGTVGVWEEKVKKDDSEFRNNVALGAEEIFFDAKNIPEKIKEAALGASRALDIQVGGVDVMTEKDTGNVYVLEVNRGPGLTYDESVSPEFKAIAEFLEKEANG